MWVTGAFNAAVVVVMILVPLLYPEALPKTLMTAMLSAPPPPPAARPPQPITVRHVSTVAALDPLTVPSRVPTTIAVVHDDPPPPDTGTGFVVMGSSVGNGVPDALNIGIPSTLPVTVKPVKPIGPAKVSSGVVAGNKISGPIPVYSPIAKAAHVSGAVVLHAIISKTGTIQSLSVVSGNEMLRANAVAAVQEWRYKPYLLNGEPTEVDTTITVNFSIGG
jgi:protein TonB